MIQPSYNPPPDLGLDLVYCDESLLVANKPAGLLSVPGRGLDKTDSLAGRMQQKFPDARIVHRLDMSTSGLLLFARGADMHQRLSRLFRERGVNKCYVAILAGRLKNSTGEVDLPLSADWPNRPRQKVDFANGKPSLTRYNLLNCPVLTTINQGKAVLSTSRVELRPVTGRTHQLRVHMAAIGHPVLGDELYGTETEGTSKRLLLHAAELSFVHPLSGALLSLLSQPSF